MNDTQFPFLVIINKDFKDFVPKRHPPGVRPGQALAARDPPKGAVGTKHLPAYLDEFVFRFSRRTAKRLSHRFGRVIEHAVRIRPTTYRALVAQPA